MSIKFAGLLGNKYKYRSHTDVFMGVPLTQTGHCSPQVWEAWWAEVSKASRMGSARLCGPCASWTPQARHMASISINLIVWPALVPGRVVSRIR